MLYQLSYVRAVRILAGLAFRPACARNKRGVRFVSFAALSLAALVTVASSAASLGVATNVSRPALRVDSRGNAEVSWNSGGARRYLLVPARGEVFPGRRLTGRDVSRATHAVSIPFDKVLRRAPDGRYWALQSWRVEPGGPVELRLSRWRGRPTQLVLDSVEPSTNGYVVSGRATFAGRPVPLWSRTPEGKRVRTYAYVDRMTAGGWKRVGGVAVRADGSFSRFVHVGAGRPTFRAVLRGPSVGSSWLPDAASRSLAAS